MTLNNMYRCGETVLHATVSHNTGWTSGFYCGNTNKQTHKHAQLKIQLSWLRVWNSPQIPYKAPIFPHTNFKITWAQSNLCQQKMSRTTACTHLVHGKLRLGGCPLTKKQLKLSRRFPGVLISTQLHFHTRRGKLTQCSLSGTNGISGNVS